jgi:NIPSNAP
MYLFTRRVQLGGAGRAGLEWAVGMRERVDQIIDLDVRLWSSAYSGGFGTVSFSSFAPDLASLEAANDALNADEGFLAFAEQAGNLSQGTDDGLREIVHGTPDPSADSHFISVINAVAANGRITKAMTAAVELAQQSEKITGVPALVATNVTGPYGGITWISAYPDIAAFEAGRQAMAEDTGWPAFVDEQVSDAFIEDPATTQSSIYRRIA